MSETEWPSFERPPPWPSSMWTARSWPRRRPSSSRGSSFRRGLIRRSFLLRALYHGLQHRLGRLDYGRLIAYGLKNIARIPVVELERIAYENFTEYVRPRLYDGVVEHFNGLRSQRNADRSGLVVPGPGDRTSESLSWDAPRP